MMDEKVNNFYQIELYNLIQMFEIFVQRVQNLQSEEKRSHLCLDGVVPAIIHTPSYGRENPEVCKNSLKSRGMQLLRQENPGMVTKIRKNPEPQVAG